MAGSGALAEDSIEAHLGNGYQALKQERYDAAIAEFRAALKMDPSLVLRARFPLGVALFESKQTAEARREFEAVRRDAGNTPAVSYYLGRLDLLDENFGGAVRNLSEAAVRPPFPDTAYQLGFAYLKQGDLKNAEKWLKAAEQANPEDSAVAYQLALVYRKLGREAEAKRAFERSAALRRTDADEALLRHECAQKLEEGPREEAHAVCGRLYDANNAQKLTALGTIYGQHGDLEAALPPLERAAELEPQSPQTQYNLAFTLYELQRFEEARAHIAQSVQQWPDVFQLNSLYGAVLLRLGRAKDAYPVLQHAHELNPGDTRTADLLYGTALTLGQESMAAARFGEAKVYFGQAAKLRPNAPEPGVGAAQAEAAAAQHSKP